MKTRKLLFSFGIMLLLFALPLAVFAQDTTPTAPMSPDQAWQLILAALGAIVAGGVGGGPLAVFIVGLLKHVEIFDRFSAPSINLTVGLLLTVAYWGAQHFGVEVQFKSVSDFLLVVGPALIGLLSTVTSASTLHNSAVSQKLPIVGYKRSA